MGDSGMDDEDETFSAHSSSSITTVSSSRAGCHMSEEECDYDFMACEKGVRMLTANLTHKEADVLLNLPSCNAQRAGIVLQHEIPRSKATHTVLREWALEEMDHGSYTTGYCVRIVDPVWSLCKCLMLCERATDSEPVGCHCLSKSFFMAMGCYHIVSPEPHLQQPGIALNAKDVCVVMGSLVEHAGGVIVSCCFKDMTFMLSWCHVASKLKWHCAQVLQAGEGQGCPQVLHLFTIISSWILPALMVPWDEQRLFT